MYLNKMQNDERSSKDRDVFKIFEKYMQVY